MLLARNVPLAARTTFRVGGAAAWWGEVASLEELVAVARWAQRKGLPFVVMGEGANALVPDSGFPGVAVRLQMDRVWIDASLPCIVAEGGARWDAVVATATEEGWWGLERLAGIPGTAGAAVVQNIGAYGAESTDLLIWADLIHPCTGAVCRVGAEGLAFSYRTSSLKEGVWKGWVVWRAAWRLSRKRQDPQQPHPQVEEAIASLDTPRRVADFIRSVRAQKLPSLTQWGTGGSFFQNPVLSKEQFRKLHHRYPELPFTAIDCDHYRIALAWLLDHALGIRGMRYGSASVYERQPRACCATRWKNPRCAPPCPSGGFYGVGRFAHFANSGSGNTPPFRFPSLPLVLRRFLRYQHFNIL
jgi:UDP-N-acetylmuramate dehydrogenase